MTAFSALVSEIVEWRLQIYLRNRCGTEGAGLRSIAEEGEQAAS